MAEGLAGLEEQDMRTLAALILGPYLRFRGIAREES